MSLAREITRSMRGDWAGQQGLVPGPGHSADDRSMSIRDAASGDDVILHSFAGDDWKPFKDQLRADGYLPDRQSRESEPAGKFYVYHDANGRAVFRVVRKAGAKGFYQQHAMQNGEWASGLNGTNPLPYRLPELIAAHTDAPVYICEGEKDADNLAALNEVTTTNPGGAGKWPDSFAHWLKGRECVALVDNDDAGRAHAADVVAKLGRAGIDCVTLALPGLPPKGDVSDWIAMGGTSAQLAELTSAAFNAPAGEPPLGFATDLPVIDPTAWQGRPVPAREWLIDGWLARGTGALLTGTGGVGKSLLAQQVATCFATGAAFMGVPVVPVVALYITCEDSADELQRRQHSINAALGCDMANLGQLKLTSLLGETGNELVIFDVDGTVRRGPLFDKIEALALHAGASFVALDHVAHLFGGNENDRHQVTAFLNTLNALALRINGTVMTLGHENKAGASYSGSTAWQGGVRQHWHLDYPEDDGSAIDPDARILSRPKANYAQRGNPLEFVWHRGAFVAADDLPPNVAAERAAVATASAENETFMACLAKATAEKRATSTSPSASNYAPRLFAEMPTGKRITLKGHEAAMQRLLHLGKIVNGQRVYQRDNRVWVTGLGPAPTLAPTPAPTLHEACTKVHINTEREDCTNLHALTPLDTTYLSGAANGVGAPDPEDETQAAEAQAYAWNTSLIAARRRS